MAAKRNTFRGAGRSGRLPIWEFASAGDLAGVQRELSAGVDPNSRDSDSGYTPLHIAAYNRHTGVVQALLHAGGDPNAIDKHGNGPLWTAVMQARGNNDIVELLLAAGADAHAKNVHGRSPHDMAATLGDGSLTSFLDAKIDDN
jgi:uncharacterized protein